MKFRGMNKCILETSIHPFGRSSYIVGEKISDFVGREEELRKFRDFIQIISQSKMSLAVRLEGPAGVGKSTLFNYLKESIQKEKTDTAIPSHYLTRGTDILSTYFHISPNVVSFKDMWSGMLRGLEAEITEETQAENFLEYVALNLVYRLFLQNPDEISKIIWGDSDPPCEQRYITLNDIIDPILSSGSDFVEKIRAYYSDNRWEIRNYLKYKINNVTYEIRRKDTKWILDLFYVLDEKNDYADNITAGKEFRNDDEIISYFNSLCELYSCAVRKELMLLVGIDEIVKFSALSSIYNEHDYYSNLGKLFIRMRDKLKNILFVFISTTEDWNQFDTVIKSGTDLEGQLKPILKVITLSQLQVHETIKVFENRMARFWLNNSERNSRYPYYPFNKEFFEYIYRYMHRDLRRSIEFLHGNIWSKFRETGEIPVINSMFDALRYVRSIDDQKLNGLNFKLFELNMIKEYFDNSKYSKSNSRRSGIIEKGFANAWNCIRQDQLSSITFVKNNPQIIIGNKVRKPDVYIELNGNLGADHTRYIEFQVKAYLRNNKITTDKIESSLELFMRKKTDLLYFITTGGGFDNKAENLVSALRKEYPNRIITPILQEYQEKLLVFLALYKEIMGRDIGKSSNHLEMDIETAKNVVQRILDQNIITFLNGVKDLPKHSMKEVDTGLRKYFPETKKIPVEKKDEKKIPIIEDKKEVITPVVKAGRWYDSYPEFLPYKVEACGLGEYLVGRTGKNKNKFTTATVERNVIRKDSWYDVEKFYNLIKFMENYDYLVKEKRSYLLTDQGIKWHDIIKSDKFNSD